MNDIMNANLHIKSAAIPRLLRQGAIFCGGILFSVWLVLVVSEFLGNHFEWPDKGMVYQGGVLMFVFAGYYLSVKRPIAGSLLTFVATGCFFLIAFATTGIWPPLAAIWLALPAALTLGAWTYSRRRRLIRRRHSLT